MSTSSLLPDVQVFMSRPAYPLGGTVVGTVLIQQPQHPSQREKGRNELEIEIDDGDTDATTATATQPLRSLLESVTVYVAGCCKIDARWHDCTNYTKIYGTTHPYVQQLREQFDAGLLEQNDDTVCFWATNGMEALDLPERSDGRRWKNNETDFQSGLRDYDDQVDDSDNDDGSTEDDGVSSINRDLLAFTFRVDIPEDLPHSVHATTCRYFYTANILVKTAREQQVFKRNFRVFASASAPNDDSGHNLDTLTRAGARVKFGNCLGLAHSNGLPCHLSATEIHRPKGQLMVVQNHCLVQQYQRNNDVQTLRVSNTSGRPVCVLTVIGSQSMCPGSCIHLQWDFPTNHDQNHDLSLLQNGDGHHDNNDWIPCHQVCACLQGEEFAIYEDKSKNRTQSFLFDTCHEWVDPGVTDRVSKTLWLSSSGDGSNGNTSHFEGGAPPCDLKTDVMEVSTWCQVDITVREKPSNNAHNDTIPTSGSGGGGFQNLSLRIPCRVRLRNSANDEQEEHDRMEQQVQPLNELLNIGNENIAFPTNDIRSDLKTLSLTMNEHVCGEENHANDGR
jgi:hypothetical protein